MLLKNNIFVDLAPRCGTVCASHSPAWWCSNRYEWSNRIHAADQRAPTAKRQGKAYEEVVAIQIANHMECAN